MPLTRAEKNDQIAHLSERFENTGGVYLADLSGMTVEKVTNFRIACRESQVTIRVFKNNVLKRAAKDTEFEPITPFLEGPTKEISFFPFRAQKATQVKGHIAFILLFGLRVCCRFPVCIYFSVVRLQLAPFIFQF